MLIGIQDSGKAYTQILHLLYNKVIHVLSCIVGKPGIAAARHNEVRWLLFGLFAAVERR